MTAQIENFRKKPWLLTLRKDGAYTLTMPQRDIEEGIWASRELLLHLRGKRQGGKLVLKERVDKCIISADRKSFRLKLTPYITVEYTRK